MVKQGSLHAEGVTADLADYDVARRRNEETNGSTACRGEREAPMVVATRVCSR